MLISLSSQPSTGSSRTANSQPQPPLIPPYNHDGLLELPTPHHDLQPSHTFTLPSHSNAGTPFLQHVSRHPDPNRPTEQPVVTTGPTSISITEPVASGEDLPSGFERKFTSDGRPFYVDHNTRTNHWTLPPSHSSSASAPQAVTSEEDLPPGFELKFNSHGQPYYVDHNTRSTHWTLPPSRSSSAIASHTYSGHRGYLDAPIVLLESKHFHVFLMLEKPNLGVKKRSPMAGADEWGLKKLVEELGVQ